MGSFKIEEKAERRFLVYQLSEGDEIDKTCFGMISNNRIPGIAQASFTQIEDERLIKFDIGDCIPLDSFLEKPVSQAQVLAIFRNIMTALDYSETYMLEDDRFFFDPAKVFIDKKTLGICLICLPVQAAEDTGSLYNLCMDILRLVKLPANDNGTTVAKIKRFLSDADAFSKKKFKFFLSGSREAPAAPAPQAPGASWRNDRPVAQPPRVPQMPQMPAKDSSQQTADAEDSDEEPMSLVFLLAHYNKENAEKYKAGKAKKAKGAGKQGKPKKDPAGKPSKAPASNGSGFSFHIPGEEEKPSFEKPGVKPVEDAHKDSVPVPGIPKQQVPRWEPPKEVEWEPPMDILVSDGPAPSLGNSDYLPDDLPDPAPAPQSAPVPASISDPPQMPEPVRLLRPVLVNRMTGERIVVDKEHFVIGRSKVECDCIIDNKYIGRNHCSISIQGDRVFVKDHESKNHTYLDGKELKPNVAAELFDGQVLRLANLDFEVEIQENM